MQKITRKAARLYFQEGQRYDIELGDAGSAFVQGSFAYKSDLFFSTENNPIVGQDAYTLYGARLGYESADASWGVALFGNNLSDEEYLTNVTDLTDFGFYARTFAAPRTFGIEFTYDI